MFLVVSSHQPLPIRAEEKIKPIVIQKPQLSLSDLVEETEKETDNQIEIIKQQEAELKKKQEEKRKQEEAKRRQEEERRKAETARKRTQSYSPLSSSSYYSISESDAVLLQKLMLSEAGNQGVKGMALVGQVVLNRAKRKHWSIRSVIYEPGQFSVVKNGALSRRIPNGSSKQALNQILRGAYKNFNAYYFVESSSYRGWFKSLSVVERYNSHIFLR